MDLLFTLYRSLYFAVTLHLAQCFFFSLNKKWKVINITHPTSCINRMSRHNFVSSCQLDLHKMLYKSVLFYDDKLVKKKKRAWDLKRLTLVLTAENTVPLQSITLKLGGKKAAEALLLQSVDGKYRKMGWWLIGTHCRLHLFNIILQRSVYVVNSCVLGNTKTRM